jgi:hypothetical protein
VKLKQATGEVYQKLHSKEIIGRPSISYPSLRLVRHDEDRVSKMACKENFRDIWEH